MLIIGVCLCVYVVSMYYMFMYGLSSLSWIQSNWGVQLTAMGQVLSEAAIEQRLRRACKNGKKKKATGGPKAVEMYKDVDARDELARILISAGFNTAPHPIS